MLSVRERWLRVFLPQWPERDFIVLSRLRKIVRNKRET